MKVKLLKHLRKKFKVEYFPSKKLFKLNGGLNTRKYFQDKDSALGQQRCDIINHGRAAYEKYSKRIEI